MDNLDLRDNEENQDHRVHKEVVVKQDPKVLEEILALKEDQDLKDPQVHRVAEVNQDRLVAGG